MEAAIRGAAHVVECELVNNRVVAAPLETRGALGEFDAASGRLHLIASAAGAHAIRDLLADSVFRIPREKLRVSIPDVGGGFGMKNVLYPEWVLVLWAARRLGRPVKWIGDRSEDFAGSAHGRDSIVRARLALDRDGRFLALETKVLANMGAYVSTVAPVVPTMAMASAMGGVYDIPLIAFQTRGVFTNTTPVDAYRGAGKPEANYLIERCIDIAAAELGMDALKLRRKNIFRRFPHASAMGLSVEQGSFAHAIDHAVAAAAGFDARRKSSRARGRLRGLGYACFLETARGQPNEVAEVRFGEDGRIDLKVGTHSNGQGHETTYAQIAADALGLPLERFRFRQGDTDDLDSGGGHGGARSMHQGGTALLLAAEGLIENARRLAARLLQTGVDAISYEAGMLRVAATGQEISLDEVARASWQMPGDDVAPGLAHQATHLCDRYTFPNGCHVAEVEIDPATGEVTLDRYVIFDDYGRLLDPRLTLGQVHGGVVQGIGQALFEHALFDAETGQILSGSLMDYALPRADDIPSFEGESDTRLSKQRQPARREGKRSGRRHRRARHHHERRDERAGAAGRAASRHARNALPHLARDPDGPVAITRPWIGSSLSGMTWTGHLVAIKVMNSGDGYRCGLLPSLSRDVAMIPARCSCADRFQRSRVIDPCGAGMTGSLRACFPREMALHCLLPPPLLPSL